MFWRFCLAGMLILGSCLGVLAQSESGQICIRSFEDRNANGLLDAGEPFLTNGVTAILRDEERTAIQTLSLSDSPTASRGEICFTALPFGVYAVSITSEGLTPTTDTEDEILLTSSDIRTIDYGVLPIDNRFQVEPADEPAEEINNEPISPDRIRILVIAGIFSIVVIGLMAILGFIIYYSVFKRRLDRYKKQVAPLVTSGPPAQPPVHSTSDIVPDADDDMRFSPPSTGLVSIEGVTQDDVSVVEQPTEPDDIRPFGSNPFVKPENLPEPDIESEPTPDTDQEPEDDDPLRQSD